MADVDDELLDRASRYAFEVARGDHLAKPRRPVPSALRRHVGFARTPPATLRVVRRVIDDDAEFRQRVADRATEIEVGRAGLLWLTRPEGWHDELDRLREFLAAADEETAERRLLDGLSEQLGAARVELARVETEHARTIEELTHMTLAHQHVEAELERIRSDGAELREERNRAVRQWKQIERLRNEERAEVAAARARLDAPPPEAEPHEASAADGSGERVRAARRALSAVETDLSVLRGDLADVEGRVVAALDGVARTLAELADPVPAPPAKPVARPGPGRRRTPPPLVRGLLDDTVEAAEALARIPEITILIDGYNLTLGALPDVPLAEGRHRLVSALDDLHARTGARSLVVFDGSEAGTGAGRSRWVQVRFTDHAVEADDVLIDLVRTWSGVGPLVVVSSDNRVRDGVRRGGARPLASAPFAELLGLG
ncbi:MAG: hypothetical protein GY929_09175 [Actinomycetia bacterium]|nr:hypothetical protein [Actinomycetes bacterium]